MKKVGVTGGIGSGKTLVCKIFANLDIPVFDADKVAKECYGFSSVKTRVIKLLGKDVYDGNNLNRQKLARIVFRESKLLKELEQIIHPCVKKEFMTWVEKQHAPYVIEEAAILIESGAYREMDHIILVKAPEALRMNRVVRRDASNKAEVKNRMDKQLTDIEREKFADFIIDNDEKNLLIPQIIDVHQKIINS